MPNQMMRIEMLSGATFFIRDNSGPWTYASADQMVVLGNWLATGHAIETVVADGIKLYTPKDQE